MNNTYTGSIERDCAAVATLPPKADIRAKIKAAIAYTVADNLIFRKGDNTFAFWIDGEGQFFNHLMSICTPAEKADFLYEWVLDGDTDYAVEICDYLMGSHNPLHSIARSEALKLINHRFFEDAVADALAAQELPI